MPPHASAIAHAALLAVAACTGGPIHGSEDAGSSDAAAESIGTTDAATATSTGPGTTGPSLVGWPESWYGTYHQAGAGLGESLTEPTIGYAWPNMLRFDESGVQFFGFDCAGGDALMSTYEVEVDDELVRILDPPIAGEPRVGFDSESQPVLSPYTLYTPDGACGHLQLEWTTPTHTASETWTLGELCLTNSCDEDAFDDEWTQDLCPDAVTSCSQ